MYKRQEIGIVKFCEYISGKGKDKEKETTGKSDIPGLIFRKGDEILVNERNAIENLDSIDFPDWESIDPNTYPHAPHGTFTKSLPTAPIITSRGCPYSCTYLSLIHIFTPLGHAQLIFIFLSRRRLQNSTTLSPVSYTHLKTRADLKT